MKSLAYVCAIIDKHHSILKDEQIKSIIEYAKENEIEIIKFIEDEDVKQDLVSRPGIKQILDYKDHYDSLLANRVWVFSRDVSVLERFFELLDVKQVRLECSTTLWDCVSQIARKHFAKAKNIDPGAPRQIVYANAEYKVKKPNHEYFKDLVK